MKTIITSILFLSFCNILSIAQNVAYEGDSISAAKHIARTQYIFEGKLIKQKNYLVPLNEDRIVTNENYKGEQYGKFLISNIIQVTKVIKGDIKEGTIEIITEGGGMGNIQVQISDGIALGRIGVFLCKLSEFKSSGFSTDNKISLQISSRGISYSTTAAVNGLGLSFNNPQELYQFLQRQPNIILKDTTVHPLILEYFNKEKKK